MKKVMKMNKFEIPKQAPTRQIGIRFPNDLIDDVENAIIGKDCTFSGFVKAAVDWALEEIEENQGDNNEKV